MNVLSSRAVTEVEKEACDKLGLSEQILMENAASALFEVWKEKSAPSKKTAVLCGTGNNGGDGMALARRILASGGEAVVFIPEKILKLSPCAAFNMNILKNMKAGFGILGEDLEGFEVIVDAMFGTGLSRPLDGEYGKAAEKASSYGAFKIAVDVPSGLAADSPSLIGPVFKADVTVTFSALKICHCAYPAREICGEILLKNVSVPENLVSQAAEAEFLDREMLPRLRRRPRNSHKGTYGHAAVIGGSVGLGGAPYLAALAAYKTGTGLCTGVFPEKASSAIFSATPELTVLPVEGGSFFRRRDADFVLRFIEDRKIKSVCLGNGAGRDPETAEFLKEIIKNTPVPLVLDADGINAISTDDISDRKAVTVLTPHLGEFSRLTGYGAEETESRRFELAAGFAESCGITLVLKSADTFITGPSGKTVISAYGSTALSKGGSGDCLAGSITGFLCQGYGARESAVLGCYLMGRSGEMAASSPGERTALATDVIGYFSEVFHEL